MSNIAHDYIEDYVRGLLTERKDCISEMETYAAENNVPIIHPEVAQLLRILISTKNIKSILEVGTAIGYSASVMAETAGKDCSIVTIERDENMVKLAEENIKKAGFEDNISIKMGDACETLKAMEGSFDLIFLDAGKGHYDHFLPDCLRMLKINGLIVSDNVLFRGMVASNELLIRRKITIVKRMRKYLEHISSMECLKTVVLPAGDGIAISTKVGEYSE